MNLTEDYCSFELSKFLKEKGFKQEGCHKSYSMEGPVAPTHQMAMKWLRKIKKIFINIRYVPESKDDNISPCYVVDIYNENNGSWVSNHIVSTSFEVAAEESLTFCLINLI